MIHGVGTDIVRIERMRAALARHGSRFAARVLNEAELAEFADQRDPARFLAKRFAAKEAAAKALGTGFRGGLTLRDIRVLHDIHGRPELCFSGEGEALLRRRGIAAVHLSLSDEDEYAVAFVAMEAASNKP